MLGYVVDILGSNFLTNSDKLNKLNVTLTFDVSKVKQGFEWNPHTVLNQFKIY